MTKARDDKLFSSHKDNVQYEGKIFINYKLNAYCKSCNMEFPKPKLNCPVCNNPLRQHSKAYDP